MGRRRLPISSTGASGGGSGTSGGIFGSGMHFGIGTGVVCQSKDNSYYCNLVKIVNTILMIIMITIIFYLVIIVIGHLRSGGGIGGGKLALFGKKG